MRVLIVEDDRTAADFLAKALAEAGYQPEIAGDGETGLELAMSSTFGVLIVDRMLPKLDGLSLVERLRARGRSHSGPDFECARRCRRPRQRPARRR